MPAAIPVIATIGGALVAKNQASKQKSAAKTAENIMQGREGQQLSLVEQESQAIKDAAIQSRKNMLEAGAATPEETERVGRYKTKATTPAETLMTESGPIAQAVARRVQERVDQPGLDYNTNSQAFTEGITQPLWAAIKARGIAAPPGSEGGGLGTQQYMKGAEPALAELRANQISQDITRGQSYGTEARGLQDVYTQLENALAEAIRNRLYQAGISGAAAEQAGLTEGSQLAVGGSQQARSQSGLNELYGKRESEAQANKNAYDSAMISMLDSIVSGLGGVSGGASTIKAPTTVPTATPKTIPTTTKTTETPYSKQLQQISLANALRNARYM